jgi:hypothetical protein
MLWYPELAEMESANAKLKRIQTLTNRASKVQAQAFKVQFEAMASGELAKILQALAKEGPDVVAQKLKDKQPVTRWVAALIAARKRLHLEAQLIQLVADPDSLVRQGAREALIRLSRGNDFGPLPKATAQQIAQLAQAWRQWLALQDPPERIREYLPCPQLAEADETPGDNRELLPRPQPAQAEDAQP